jgi:hypothetical protein
MMQSEKVKPSGLTYEKRSGLGLRFLPFRQEGQDADIEPMLWEILFFPLMSQQMRRAGANSS